MASPALFDSLRRLLDTAADIAQVRLQLLGTELEKEKLRLIDALVWAAAGLLLLGLAAVLMIGFVVLMFWEGYRLPAIGVLTLLFAAGGVGLLRRARHRLREAEGGLFGLSIGELQRDRAGLGGDPAQPPSAP